MLRVGFDDQIFRAQRRGGISKYFVELMTRLPEHGIEPVVLSTSTRNLHLAESGLVAEAAPLGRALARVDWLSWRAAGLPNTAPRPRPALDLMHHTFTHGAYLRRWSGPRVVTLFDMTPEIFPGYFRLGNPHFAKHRYCQRSDAIISISQNTADDMYRFYSRDLEHKTRVIPFGVGEQFFTPVTPTLDLPQRYLLFVGVRTGYKHYTTAFEAFRRLAVDDSGLDFVVVGGGPWRTEEASAIEGSGLAGRIHRLTPSDAEMTEVYARAAAFVFPSIYEGFGLPTLEALAAGTPTVLADASCSREVGGDAALYFVPGDVADLVAKLREAMSPAAAAAAQTLGPARGREFSWDRVAASTADLYRSVAMKE